jgi:6,7-dimethyl-8-ribityllumazine synthase
MTKISIICGSFHKEEITKMLEFAQQEAELLGLEIAEVVWVPGSMEIPLAIDRQLRKDEIDAAACLGIIEKGQTKHGLAMGQAVTKAIVDLQLKYDKPIGLGIIGPGAKPEHIDPRIEPHARAAIACIFEMV